MCGILGQINKKEDINLEVFKEMLKTLEKRGPDEGDFFVCKKIALGHRRLAVIDLSANGCQPMSNEDGRIKMICNGEIYNYREIKKQLSPKHLWKSQSDNEILIHAYEEWGWEKMLEKIEGMFALAIYDQRCDKIFLARDYFGKKPLYYYLDENTFIFSSEMKALLKNSEIKNRLAISDLLLAKFLIGGYIPAPDTIFKNVKKLSPASALIFDLNNFKITREFNFWNLGNMETGDDLSEKEILDKTEELLWQAIKKRLVADVPVGIFLSGGLDSSLTAYYASKINPELMAFTIGYEKYSGTDESNFASRSAKKINIRHRKYFLTQEEVKEDFLEIFDYLDEPLADAAIIPLYSLAKRAKKNITVALGGDGGDEIFGGYQKYRAQVFIEKYRYLGWLFKTGRYFFPPGHNYGKLFQGFNWNFVQRQLIFGSGGFEPEELTAILKTENFSRQGIFQAGKKYLENFRQNDTINKSLFLDCRMQIPNWYMAKVDRATMANGLEMRSPLLDKNLAEFVFSLSGNWKIRNGQMKYLLKKIGEKYFDKKFVYRKKQGFNVPLATWIKDDLEDIFREYLFRGNSYFNGDKVKEMYRQQQKGKIDNSYKLLRIFGFNYWLKKYG